MNDAVRLIALNATFALAGFVVIRFAGVPGGRGWRGTLVGLSPAVGLAACGIAAALCAMTGLGVGLLATGILVVFVLAAAGLLLAAAGPASGRSNRPWCRASSVACSKWSRSSCSQLSRSVSCACTRQRA